MENAPKTQALLKRIRKLEDEKRQLSKRVNKLYDMLAGVSKVVYEIFDIDESQMHDLNVRLHKVECFIFPNLRRDLDKLDKIIGEPKKGGARYDERKS
jgi:hypothetical protein